jgi:hypothetical protein
MDDMDINKTDSDQKILKCDTVIYSLLLCWVTGPGCNE